MQRARIADENNVIHVRSFILVFTIFMAEFFVEYCWKKIYSRCEHARIGIARTRQAANSFYIKNNRETSTGLYLLVRKREKDFFSLSVKRAREREKEIHCSIDDKSRSSSFRVFVTLSSSQFNLDDGFEGVRVGTLHYLDVQICIYRCKHAHRCIRVLHMLRQVPAQCTSRPSREWSFSLQLLSTFRSIVSQHH